MLKVIEEESASSHDHALVHVSALEDRQLSVDFLELLADITRAGCLSHVLKEAIEILDTLDGVLNALNKLGVELLAAPLDAVLDRAWEVSKGTERNRILLLIFAVTISLRNSWDNHLRVGCSSESARLE